MGSGANTKGWIKNNVTGAKKSFHFNPETFSYSRGTTYSDISSPGMQYPLTQFVKGNIREFPVELYFNDRPRYTGLFKEWTWFIGAFLTPEKNQANYTKPPAMTFCHGTWIRICVLVNLDIEVIDLDPQSGDPIEFKIKMTLRQVGY